MPKDVGRKYWIEIATMIVCAIIAAVPSYLTFFKGDEPAPARPEQTYQIPKPATAVPPDTSDQATVVQKDPETEQDEPKQTEALKPVKEAEPVQTASVFPQPGTLEQTTVSQTDPDTEQDEPKQTETLEPVKEAEPVQTASVFPQPGTLDQPTVSPAPVQQPTVTLGTSGQIETAGGRIAACDQNFDILVQAGLQKVVLTGASGTEYYLTEGGSITLVDDCRLTMTNIKKTFGGAIAQLKWSSQD